MTQNNVFFSHNNIFKETFNLFFCKFDFIKCLFLLYCLILNLYLACDADMVINTTLPNNESINQSNKLLYILAIFINNS